MHVVAFIGAGFLAPHGLFGIVVDDDEAREKLGQTKGKKAWIVRVLMTEVF